MEGGGAGVEVDWEGSVLCNIGRIFCCRFV